MEEARRAGGDAEAGGLGMKVDASQKSIRDSLRESDRNHQENSIGDKNGGHLSPESAWRLKQVTQRSWK